MPNNQPSNTLVASGGMGGATAGVGTNYTETVKSAETFVKVGDITAGVGTHKGFEDYVQYFDLRFSFDKLMSPDAHDKLYSSGTVTMTNVRIVTKNHHTVPNILLKLWTGDKIAMIETVRTENTGGGTLREVERLTFKENYVTHVDYHGDLFEFWFRALIFSIKKTPTKQDGTQEGIIENGYDFTLNNLVGA